MYNSTGGETALNDTLFANKSISSNVQYVDASMRTMQILQYARYLEDVNFCFRIAVAVSTIDLR